MWEIFAFVVYQYVYIYWLAGILACKIISYTAKGGVFIGEDPRILISKQTYEHEHGVNMEMGMVVYMNADTVCH